MLGNDVTGHQEDRVFLLSHRLWRSRVSSIGRESPDWQSHHQSLWQDKVFHGGNHEGRLCCL